jgi:fructose-bisphosphate aldolase class I
MAVSGRCLMVMKQDSMVSILCIDVQGLVPLPGSNSETSTRGLETLESECRQYRRQGARFTKWRAALKVADGLPSEAAIQRNAEELAEYAAIAQVLHL